MQCVFQKIKLYFLVCYLIDFAGMKHTAYNFLKCKKLISAYFSNKYHFIKVNSFKLFLLSNRKHPLYPIPSKELYISLELTLSIFIWVS